ncbi:MAG: hypothetical protein AAB702_01930 [Patescibacteria group bacterium]
MKNKKNNPQFPNIYRIITENKTLKYLSKLEFRLLSKSKYKKEIIYFLSFILLFITVLLLVGISALAIKLYQEVNVYSKTISQRETLQGKINFWDSFTQKYDGFKDAYFQIALLEYQLGNFEKARQYNKKALLLDPGFKDAKNLEVLLENK